MDIRQLQHLVALVELGTVHAAAQDQFISQPGLSGSIKRLEAQLGVILFERDGRGMKPSTKGHEFYSHAKHILEQVRLAKADLEGEPTRLVIGMGEVRPSRFTAAFHDALLASYPNLILNFIEGHFDTLYTQVQNGDVDVAFLPVAPENVSTTVLGYPLVESKFCVFCSATHPLAQFNGRVPVDELKKYNWVKNGAAPVMAPYHPSFPGRKKNPLSGAGYVTAGSQQMAKDLILHSDVLGYGPRVTLDDELATGRFVELDLPITNQYLTIMEIRCRDLYSPVLDTAFKIAEDYFKQLETV